MGTFAVFVEALLRVGRKVAKMKGGCTLSRQARRLRMGAGKSGESPALSRSGNRGRKPLGSLPPTLWRPDKPLALNRALGRRGE